MNKKLATLTSKAIDNVCEFACWPRNVTFFSLSIRTLIKKNWYVILFLKSKLFNKGIGTKISSEVFTVYSQKNIILKMFKKWILNVNLNPGISPNCLPPIRTYTVNWSVAEIGSYTKLGHMFKWSSLFSNKHSCRCHAQLISINFHKIRNKFCLWRRYFTWYI